MDVIARTPSMTREQFLDWVETQEEAYEFDGFEPIHVNGGSVNHIQIAFNINFALRTRLEGTSCRVLGLGIAIATTRDAIRYPDAVVTRTQMGGTDRIVPNPIIIFEIISPTSGHIDRIQKMREYAGVDSIRRYVILEQDVIGATVLSRPPEQSTWTASALTTDDILPLPEIGIEVPLRDFYRNCDLPTDDKRPDERVQP